MPPKRSSLWVLLLFYITHAGGLLLSTIQRVLPGIVSFDLDDTIWPIRPVVEQANEAVARRWRSLLHADTVQKTMKTIRMETKSKKVPLSYSELRTAAYNRLLSSPQSEIENGGNEYDAEAHEAFKYWVDARNAAAEEFLFADAVKCLREFQRAGWLTVAITNGLGDPKFIPSLRPLFAFCVSGEESGIFPHRKPSPVIFEAARSRAASTKPGEQHGDEYESGMWWHVGDDAANDVFAAAECGMYTVLLNRSEKEIQPSADERNPFSTASAEQLQARAAAAATAQPDIIVSGLEGLEAKISSFIAASTKPISTPSRSELNDDDLLKPSKVHLEKCKNRSRASDEGIKLSDKVEELVELFGWNGLADATNIRCFEQERQPTIRSSLKFLRATKNKWARDRVENLYKTEFL